jgi:tetratricopeptide (TPR) repeat protein
MYLGVREIRLDEESRLALFRRAKEQSTEAIDINPTYHRYWATRAEAQRLLRDRERAKRDLRSAVDLLKFDPRHPEHSQEYKEALNRYQNTFSRIRQDDEMHTILDTTTEQQRNLRQMIGEVENARDTLEAKTQDLSQNFEQLKLTVHRIEADASANRREQIQLVAIVAAFIGLIASTVPVVGAGASRVEASGGGLSDLLLLLLIPASLIVVLIVQ